MKTVSAIDDRFAELPAFPYEPRYVEIIDDDGTPLRVHYIDEGPADAPPILLTHGEPTWSYLYRKVIPKLLRAGRRVVAIDLVGCGRSDKPVEKSDYTYSRHVAWMRAALCALDLRDATLVTHDWGGLIWLRVVSQEPERFGRLFITNTGFPLGGQPKPDFIPKMTEFADSSPKYRPGHLISRVGNQPLRDDEKRAFDAPFPDENHKAGVRSFKRLIPFDLEDPEARINRAAWEILKTFPRPVTTAFTADDFATRDEVAAFRDGIAGAQDCEHFTIENAGHFPQEDQPERLAELIIAFTEEGE